MGFFDSFLRIIWNTKGELSSHKATQLASLKMTAEDDQEFDRISHQMVRFDFELGKLFAETFLDGSDRGLYYGILSVIQRALKFGLEHPSDAKEILETKSKQNDESESLMAVTSSVAEYLCTELVVASLRNGAEARKQPLIVGFTTIIVETFELERPRPTSDVLAVRMGHYAVLAEFAFAVALRLAQLNTSYASELATDPC